MELCKNVGARPCGGHAFGQYSPGLQANQTREKAMPHGGHAKDQGRSAKTK